MSKRTCKEQRHQALIEIVIMEHHIGSSWRIKSPTCSMNDNKGSHVQKNFGRTLVFRHMTGLIGFRSTTPIHGQLPNGWTYKNLPELLCSFWKKIFIQSFEFIFLRGRTSSCSWKPTCLSCEIRRAGLRPQSMTRFVTKFSSTYDLRMSLISADSHELRTFL